MKKCLLMLIVLCATFAFAAEKSEEGDSDVEKLKKQLEQYKKELDELKTRVDESQDVLEENEERIDEVETSTLVDRLQMKADFRFTMNNYFYKDNYKLSDLHVNTLSIGTHPLLKKQLPVVHTVGSYGLLYNPKKNGVDDSSIALMNVRGRIKMTSNLGKNIQFTSWLTMYKQFFESRWGAYSDVQVPTYDTSRGYYPGDSSVYMERLYIDWFATDWLAFTIGRGPTADGIPYGIRNDSPSLGTAPESAINAPVDSIYMTFDFDKIAGLKDTFLRFAAIPRVYLSDDIENNLFVNDPEIGEQMVFAAQIESVLPFEGSRVSLYGYYTPKLKAPDVDRGEFDVHGSSNLGSFMSLNLAAQFTNMFSLPVDMYLSGTVSGINTVKAKEDSDQGYLKVTMDVPGSEPLHLKNLTIMGASKDKNRNLVGYMIYGGFRVKLPIKFFGENVKIGSDVNYGSQKFYGYFVPDTTGLNRFGTRGLFSESYVMLPIHTRAHVKLGYIYNHIDYPWGTFLQKVMEFRKLMKRFTTHILC